MLGVHGKSTLFELYIEYLKSIGVADNQITHINLEEVEHENLHNYKELHNYVMNRLQKDKMNYIFIDEVQKCEGYEKAVDSLYVKKNTDVYITGSNANMLSRRTCNAIITDVMWKYRCSHSRLQNTWKQTKIKMKGKHSLIL